MRGKFRKFRRLRSEDGGVRALLGCNLSYPSNESLMTGRGLSCTVVGRTTRRADRNRLGGLTLASDRILRNCQNWPVAEDGVLGRLPRTRAQRPTLRRAAMNSATSAWILLAILVAAAVVAVVGIYLYRRRQSERLKTRFGGEYDRTVKKLGDQSRAEAELKHREARVARFAIRPLTEEQAARFTQAWNRVQGRFVDSPGDAVVEADELVTELMTARGYPMSDFERRASDISVDHPGVVESYRAARVIAAKNARGETDTEELRRAIVHYRTLFADLLEVPAPQAVGRPQRDIAVQS